MSCECQSAEHDQRGTETTVSQLITHHLSLITAFVGGLAGSLHCVGMCGGFPLALARGGTSNRLLRQVLYNLGRLNTLVFIGAVSGAAGAVFVATGPAHGVERLLAILAGSFMIVVGLEVLGVLS